VAKVELEVVLQRGWLAITCGCIPWNGLMHVNNFFLVRLPANVREGNILLKDSKDQEEHIP
jgi:hypothetical protein